MKRWLLLSPTLIQYCMPSCKTSGSVITTPVRSVTKSLKKPLIFDFPLETLAFGLRQSSTRQRLSPVLHVLPNTRRFCILRGNKQKRPPLKSSKFTRTKFKQTSRLFITTCSHQRFRQQRQPKRSLLLRKSVVVPQFSLYKRLQFLDLRFQSTIRRVWLLICYGAPKSIKIVSSSMHMSHFQCKR